jgi:bifunctional UDP-N-acetylglucosamine pyrophosphorylase / glucosamine-1-phosphate N-acetyltransferase
MQAAAIVLAAGEGTRMRSSLPKVAHEILGVPIVRYVIDATRAAGVERVVTVVGHGADTVVSLVPDSETVVQERQLGTGHAVSCARDALADYDGPVLVVAGDVPLVRPETLEHLLHVWSGSGSACVLLTTRFPDPAGYGRIVRDDAGHVSAIVEHKDLSADQADISECNVGIYCFDCRSLFASLSRISPANAQGEYYLTDVVGLLYEDGLGIDALELEDVDESHGINTRVQLAAAARIMQRRINERHMLAGVTMTDPDLVWVGPSVRLGRDVVLEPMTVLSGSTSVEDGARIGPSTRLFDTVVEADAVVEQSSARSARIGERATVGPNAFLRPGTVLAADSKVGSFVEVKNTSIGEGSKVPHLSYMGDATIGKGVNVGAGAITCNYDGREKHATVIGDGAFIGSDTMLVAPVRIGPGAITGAGSAIAKDVPPDALGIERTDQRNIEGWAKRKKSGGHE